MEQVQVPVAEIIGLGAGISADALSRHGYRLRIIEIDPAVYHATKTYFNLEAFQKVNVEDGFHSVTKRARQIKKGGSDYNLEDLADLVIHDCFTGGSVPIALYTEQFWADLTLSIKATGHLVVNFAGVIESEISRAILRTLWHSFPQCRVFEDQFGPSGEFQAGSLKNVVFVCSMSHSPLLTFRPATRTDLLESPLRAHVFSHFLSREVLPDHFINESEEEEALNSGSKSGRLTTKFLLESEHSSSFRKWKMDSAIATWEAMREIMPVEAWAAY